MNLNFSIESIDLGYAQRKGAVYSIVLPGNTITEFERFLSDEKIQSSWDFEHWTYELEDLVTTLGFLDQYFREENEVDAFSHQGGEKKIEYSDDYSFLRLKRGKMFLVPRSGNEPIEVDPLEFLNGPLRLYCCRYREKTLILGNGVIKTTDVNQDDPDIMEHWTIIRLVYRALTESIRKGNTSFDRETGSLGGILDFSVKVPEEWEVYLRGRI